MWHLGLYHKLFKQSNDGCTLSTFTAKGEVRRGLKAAGFKVQKVKGFDTKWHMTTAVKDLISPTVPWFKWPDSTVDKTKRVAIIGAGIAGSSCARILAQEGYTVHVYDKQPHVASGASGNARGLLMPLVSKKPDQISNFYNEMLAFSRNYFKEFKAVSKIKLQYGCLDYAYDKARFERLSEGRHVLSSEQVNCYSEDPLILEYPEAMSLSPVDYCQYNMNHDQIDLQQGFVESIERHKNHWQLHFDDGESKDYDIVIIANAWDALRFEQTEHLPIERIRGQVAILDKAVFDNCPELPMSHKGYLIPLADGKVLIGATYDKGDKDPEPRLEDQHALIHELHEYCPGVINLERALAHPLSGRVAFRAASPDHYPVIGPVLIKERYETQFEELRYGRPNDIFPEA